MIIRGQLHDNSCKKNGLNNSALSILKTLITRELKNLQTQKLMKPETKSKWDTIIKLAIAILSAIAGAIGASACSVII